MSNNDLGAYLRSHGGPVAACRSNPSTECKSLEKVVERARYRFMEQFRVPRSGSRVANERRKEQANQRAIQSTRWIEFGWVCYNFRSCAFRQVLQLKGGGTRHLRVPKEVTMAEVMQKGIKLFFPNGTSRKGSAKSFTFEIRDFSGNAVHDDDNIEEAYNRTKVKMLRLYLCSTRKYSNHCTCNESAETEQGSSDILDSSRAISLTTPDDELMSLDDYFLPDLPSSENDSQCIAPERSNVEVGLFKLKIPK